MPSATLLLVAVWYREDSFWTVWWKPILPLPVQSPGLSAIFHQEQIHIENRQQRKEGKYTTKGLRSESQKVWGHICRVGKKGQMLQILI